MAKTIHRLKVHSQFWPALKNGSKPFEVRLNDRKFHVGDVCELREYDPSFGYKGEPIQLPITYILANEDFPLGVPIGYVVLGFGQHPNLDDGK
jgi:hypothetical protein